MVEANAHRRHGCELSAAIVEDEKELAWMYEIILARIGIPVSFIALSGPEAVSRFSQCRDRPRIVLMDNRLPGLSGVEATREILRVEPDTRIIFLSADVGARADAIRAGAFMFLAKPASIHDIICAVERAISPSTVADVSPERASESISGGW